MKKEELQMKINKENELSMNVVLDINDIPHPTVVFMLPSENFLINDPAMKLLEIKSYNPADVKKWWEMNPKLIEIIQHINNGPVLDQKHHVILFNGKQEIISFSSSIIHSSPSGNVYLINLSKASDKCSMCSIATILSMKEEIVKLKPYLNKTGRSIFDKIMDDFFTEKENQRLTLDDLVYYEKELRIIQKTYPFLSNREVILCTLLVNNMSAGNIANITNRSESAVFVNIHRINKKLNLNNKNELIQTLRNLVKSDNDQWLVEEFNL